MRSIEFKMERQGLVKIGDKVEISEGKLPASYYYTIEPAVAMSGNLKLNERLMAKEGVVTDIKETPRGFFVTCEFDED